MAIFSALPTNFDPLDERWVSGTAGTATTGKKTYKNPYGVAVVPEPVKYTVVDKPTYTTVVDRFNPPLIDGRAWNISDVSGGVPGWLIVGAVALGAYLLVR